MNLQQKHFTPKRIGGVVVAFLILIVFASAGWTSIDETDHCFKTRYGRVMDADVSPGLTGKWWVFEFTCLPMTDQQIPHAEEGDGAEGSWLQVGIETKDRVPLSLPIRTVFRYDPANILEVYMDKRRQNAILAEVRSGIIAGTTQAGNQFTLDEIFDGGFERLQHAIAESQREQLGRLAQVVNVYIGEPAMPANIRQARNQARERAEQIQQEVQQLQKDSIAGERERIQAVLAAAATRERAAAYADSVEQTMSAEAAAFARNAQLVGLRRAEAEATALSKLLGNCTSNCVVGADVLSQWLSRQGG